MTRLCCQSINLMPDFEIRPLTTPDEFHAAEELQRVTWRSDDLDIVPLHLLLTAAKNGGVVLGAFAGSQLVGFVFGFAGVSQRQDAAIPLAMRLKHCSHQMGVRPEWQSRGVGYALKAAQREVVRAQGLRLITWTFDPLESKNAHLNIAKLGAVCNTYIQDYYGELRDDLNRGLATDRFQVDWWIASRRVEACFTGRHSSLRLAADAIVLNPARWDDRGLPVPGNSIGSQPTQRFLVEFPADFQAIKRADKALAAAWRLHLRSLCETAFATGFTVTDYIYEPGARARSFYVLQHIASNEDSLNNVGNAS